MKNLLRYLKGYWGKTVLGPLFKLTEAVFELIVPLAVAYIIDTAIPEARGGVYRPLIFGGVLIFILGAAGLGFSLTAQFFASRASAGFGTNVRNALYRHINTLSAVELDRFSAPTLVTRLLNDTAQTQNAVAMFIRLVTRVPFIVVGSVVMAFIIHPLLALIFVGAGLITGAVPFVLMRFTQPGYREVQQGLDNIGAKTRETLAGVRVIRAFGREADEQAGFAAASKTLAQKSIRVGGISALLNPFAYALVNLSIIAILYFGGVEVSLGNLTQGQVIALINYLTSIMHTLLVFANLAIVFSKASASAARINEVFETRSSMEPGKGAAPLIGSPAVECRDVCFAYPGGAKNTLENLSFTVMPGQTLGILGGTGSGKSTVLNLILRRYDAGGGEIRLFGRPVSAYTEAELRALIGCAPQKAELFAGTVRENLLWGNAAAAEADVELALKVSQSAEFVSKKAGGADARVEAKGKNFSGGQRQRLSIARAVIGRAPILILDDATSALDFSTEARLRRALKKLPRELTTLLVSQRVTSVKNADIILVLEDGRPAGLGTHASLLKDCALYREIYEAQTKGVSA
ncbi:MAG: ABC transporter ATP-binding protein/permease [Clostridiales bacterium]|jgi:ATP-binding cassette subfamily B protein|nr:ABC transporter ATP-binding protein/permease [Clostridiales bacterium]